MDKINFKSKKTKGSVFLLYLLDFYLKNEKIEFLIHDLLTVNNDDIDTYEKQIGLKKYIQYADGFKIPYWVRYNSFLLAIKNDWQIKSFTDLLSVLSLKKKVFKELSKNEIICYYEAKYSLVIPRNLKEKFLNSDKFK